MTTPSSTKNIPIPSDSPWIHFLQIKTGSNRAICVNPAHVIKVDLYETGEDAEAQVIFYLSNGEKVTSRGNEASNAARVFSPLGIAAQIAEEVRDFTS